MSEVILYEGVAPSTPPAGGITIYAKIDKRMYWKDDTGTETPFYPSGAGTGDLLSDGTVPLVANWDVGAFEITMLRANFDTTTGQPFTVASSDKVVGLNADLLDGFTAADFLAATDIDTLAKLNAVVTDATLWDYDVTTVATANWFLDEDNMASDDATKVASQQSVKAYVDSKTAGANIYQGGYNASTNTPDLTTSPNAILKGQYWVVETAGSSFYSTNLEVGDTVIAEQDDPSLVTHWTILQTNLDAASVKTLYESNADTNAFTDADETKLDGIDPIASRQSNLAAAVDPTATDDTNAGYEVGSIWINTTEDTYFICVDATAAAAVWSSGGGGGLTPVFQSGNFTADAGNHYLIDTTSSSSVVTLPAGVDLDNMKFSDSKFNASVNNITLNPDGAETIDDDTTFIIDQNGGDAEIAYDSGNTNWQLSADGTTSVVNLNDFTGFSGVNAQTGTTYEFVSSDLSDLVTASNAAASTYDVPDSFAEVGETLSILNIGAGTVTITVAGSDTLGSTDNDLTTGKAGTLVKTAATTWWLIGGA